MYGYVEKLLQALHYSFRQLRKTPGFTAVVVVTLALGIGANTAVFSVMDAVLLRSLPVRNPQELVYLHTSDFPGGQTGYGDTSMRMQVYEALRAEKRVFADLMAWVPLSTTSGIPARFGSEPEEIRADMVSGNFFSGLGVAPAQGRVFDLEDEQQHSQVAILSYDYWTRRFARSASVVGETLFIKGVPFTIVGIAAPRFVGLDQGKATDVWVPFQISQDIKPWGVSRGVTTYNNQANLYGSKWWFLLTIGRLQPGISKQQALAYLTPIFQHAAIEGLSAEDLSRHPKPPVLTFTDAKGMEGMRETYEQPLRVLMGMVALVLVIAVGNVAMLLVARNAARQREFSLRMALGGSQLRMFLHLLTESLLLVGSGAAVGWLFAVWATKALARWSLLEHSLAPNSAVLIFTLIVSAVVALVFGIAPLRSAVRVPIGLALKTSTATAFQDRGNRGGQLVVALQMSMCVVLLVGAGLLVRTLRNLETLNLGLRPAGLLVFGVTPQQEVHNDAEAQRFYQALLTRMRTMPGVESATVMRQRLGQGWSSNTDAFVDGQAPKVTGWASMRWNAVGPDFLHVLGIPLLLGRDFNDADTSSAPYVVIVNETFAKRYLPNSPPIGHVVSFNTRPDAKRYTIVGVAADSKYTEVREEQRPMAYFPYTQVPGILSMQIELRTAGDPGALLPEARKVVNRFAANLALLDPKTQEEQFAESLSQERLFARLAGFFGLLAVVLVATGLYATLAYKVVRRTAEIGVRMAIGAQRGQVLWMVLRESLVLCAFGTLLGIPAAIAGARLLKAMLFGLQPGDPLTLIGATGGIALVTLTASFLPARRASSLNPMVALRCE
jgi:predicted permease